MSLFILKSGYCLQATLYNVKLLYGFVTRSAAIAHALEKAKHSG